MSTFRDFFHYIARPYFIERKEKWSTGTVITLSKLLFTKLTLLIAVYYLTGLFFEIFDHEKPERKFDILNQINYKTFIIIAVLIPFIEELCFRSWLRTKWGILYVLPIFLLITWCVLGRILLIEINIYIFMTIATLVLMYVALIGMIQLKMDNTDELVQMLFPFAFWSSTTMFALVHLSNFAAGQLEFFDVLLVLPQFISGSVFAYACARFGFLAAFGYHAIWNGSVMFMSYLVMNMG